MKILIIGGTVFVGRHIAECAVSRGHDVTVFHRGSKGTGIVAGVHEILGDRNTDLGLCASQDWDVVIDSCAYVPRVAKIAADTLNTVTKRYVFISTISVYSIADNGSLFVAENPPCGTEEVTGETYGRLKVECENVLTDAFGDRLTVVRPGMVAGPFDPTNRFTYWVERFTSCETVLVPAQYDQPMELIDARDLAEATIALSESGTPGVFDAVGAALTFGDVIDACQALRPVTQRFEFEASECDVQLGQELPLCYPLATGKAWKYEAAPLFQMKSTAPVMNRPLAETAADTLTWSYNRDRSVPVRYGMTRQRETDLMDQVEANREAE